MGYRGKVREQLRAGELRHEGFTLAEIAAELGVSKSSVSLWVRDIPFEVRVNERTRQKRPRRPHALHVAKLRQIDELDRRGIERLGDLTEPAFLAAGAALYAGEGGKTDGEVSFPNSDPAMIRFFLAWLRHFFAVDESRLRVRLYLHDDLDLEAAVEFWIGVTGIPRSQFTKPYRAVADGTLRKNRHATGCPSVRYTCATTHRAVMGLVRALLSSPRIRGSSIGGAGDC
jgi:transcriptional regulator with XRE-family HTH domain